MAEKRITWDLLKILLQKIYKRLDGLIRDVRQKAQQIPIGGRPMFEDGIIEMELYNNLSNKPGAAATLELIDTPPDCPIKRDEIRKYTLPWNTPVAPNLGGFEQYIQTAPNKVFLHRFIAKLPKGTYFTVNYNDHGDGAETIWLTKTYGTGKYEIYAYQIQCGATGSFKTIGYVSFYEGNSTKLDRSKPFEAYIAEANIYELTTPSVQPVSLPEVNKLIDKKMQDAGGLKVEPKFVNEDNRLTPEFLTYLKAYIGHIGGKGIASIFYMGKSIPLNNWACREGNGKVSQLVSATLCTTKPDAFSISLQCIEKGNRELAVRAFIFSRGVNDEIFYFDDIKSLNYKL